MFRDLAKCTARLKGGRYDGAVISSVTWEKAGAGAKTAEPIILVDKHQMLKVRAVDASGALTLSMLLGRSAPLPANNLQNNVILTAKIKGTRTIVTNMHLGFTVAEILDFVTAINDTNPLHREEFFATPLVPGLAILEKIIANLPDITALTMKFSAPSFAGDAITVNFEVLP